jgi:uncharacterized membrane protein
LHIQQNLLAGLLTILPLAAVWFVLKIVIDVLADIGRPIADWLAATVQPLLPETIQGLFNETTLYVVAALLTLVLLYAVGMVAKRVIGQRVLDGFEALIQRVPFVHMIYNSTKKVVAAFKPQTERVQRVVLVDFPHAEMRAIGFVMNTFKEESTGRDLVAVFVPTAPNPTSGYLEILPADKTIFVDMTFDQAMAMVVSGGAIGPDKLTYLHRDGVAPPDASPAPTTTAAAAAGQ